MNENYKKVLGEPLSTAKNKLNKKIMFFFIKKYYPDCYRCGAEMTSENWTYENKIPWLYSEDPLGYFFDLENIAFSHEKCNYGDSRKALKKGCPSISNYRAGCRCDGCVALNKRYFGVKRNKKTLKKSVKDNDRREGMDQLKMDLGTAQNRLSRNLIIDFLEKEGYPCEKCGKKITRDNYSITHKKKWIEQPFPKMYFFNLNNVIFIHSNCKKAE